MTGRDRIVAIVFGVLAVLGAAWMLVVSPERKQAGELSTQVSTAQSQLSSSEGQLANARSAQAQYASAYADVVGLGKAVPASQEVPSLIFQLDQASNHKSVEFASIVAGSGGSSSSSSAATAATATTAGFTQMPFTFVFNGSFFDLEHLFEGLNRFTLRKTSGGLQVSGRLLTIQSVKLSPLATSATQTSAGASSTLNGTITATAYVLPASQGLTGGATAAAPAASTTTASTTGAPSSPTTPAIARVTP
jgi:Tfp pilus assembly protein PilO